MDDFGAYVLDAVAALRLPTDARVVGIEVRQEAAGSLDMHVSFSTGATSWATFPTGLELTHEVHRALEVHCRLLFDAELARRRLLQ